MRFVIFDARRITVIDTASEMKTSLRPVNPTDGLSPDVRRLIDASFQNAVNDIGEEEFFYVGQNFDRKVRGVVESRIPWVRELGTQMIDLHETYKAYSAGEIELGPKALSAIGATLFYFVNPYDVVPDHLPGRGYLDDVYVFNKCLNLLKKLEPHLLAD